jgi:hypothetical protein
MCGRMGFVHVLAKSIHISLLRRMTMLRRTGSFPFSLVTMSEVPLNSVLVGACRGPLFSLHESQNIWILGMWDFGGVSSNS